MENQKPGNIDTDNRNYNKDEDTKKDRNIEDVNSNRERENANSDKSRNSGNYDSNRPATDGSKSTDENNTKNDSEFPEFPDRRENMDDYPGRKKGENRENIGDEFDENTDTNQDDFLEKNKRNQPQDPNSGYVSE